MKYLVVLLAVLAISCSPSQTVTREDTSMVVSMDTINVSWGPVVDTLMFDEAVPFDDWAYTDSVQATSPTTGITATIHPKKQSVVVRIPQQQIQVSDPDTTMVVHKQEITQKPSFFEEMQDFFKFLLFAAIVIGLIVLAIKLTK